MASLALGFAFGVGLLHLQPALPPLWPALLTLVALAGLAWRLPVLSPLVLAAAGFAWAQIHACQVLCDPFPESLARQTLDVSGRVASLPSSTDGAVRFLFRVEATEQAGVDAGFTGLVRLSWYREAPPLRVGERWRLGVRLKPPHGYANPGGFDYERWLFQEGIRATGHVLARPEPLVLDPGPGAYWIDRWRQALRDHLDRVLAGGAGSALIQALVLGERGGIAPAHWEALTRTGTNHLIAISGLHVGLVAGLVLLLVRRVWALSASLALNLAAPRAAAAAAFLAALAYSALAGFAVSTQRALIMLAVVLMALGWARTLRPAAGISLALAGVLLLDPQAVLAVGFWLSFGAVAVLLYALGRRMAGGGWWTRWGKAQWAVGLGLLPLLLLTFGRGSLIAPLVNLIAVPVFSLVLLPAVLAAALLSLVPGLALPLVLMAQLLDWAMQGLETLAGWSWSAVSLSGRPGWVWAAAFVGAALLLAPRGLPGRWTGLALLLPLALVRPSLPAPGEAELTLLDVGQGLAVVVRTREHVLVYDTGPAFPSGFNTGAAVVLPFLHEIGVPRIDTLVLSHGDRDHVGGLRGLVGRIPIGAMLSGEPVRVAVDGVLPCRAGDRWTWDGVRFEVLHPDPPGPGGNNSSCVLRVAAGRASLLLTGDVDARVERQLATEPERLQSTILVAGHHGSASSSSETFLAAVAPRWVLYSAGFANQFGFPAAEVRERARAVGAAQLDTASLGAIGLRLHPDGVDGPSAERRDRPRLWTHRAGDAGESFKPPCRFEYDPPRGVRLNGPAAAPLADNDCLPIAR
ncbi:MAG: DNA internalization-related competence protein ComEC/Rec2 [Chromatiaceae bacterium]|jgi:competence protein ComEC|nr:DNA internalization-related competence protein ComEC/Rec2 [Chromatiaceae bacterium]